MAKVKISFRPEGPNWIWSHFMKNIVDPLIKSKLLKIHKAPTPHHVDGISFFQNGKWSRQSITHSTRRELAELGQRHGLPIVIEGEEIYYLIEEKDMIIEYLKYNDSSL
jgi:hypothetical protein